MVWLLPSTPPNLPYHTQWIPLSFSELYASSKFSIFLLSFFHLGTTTSFGSGETTQGEIKIGEH